MDQFLLERSNSSSDLDRVTHIAGVCLNQHGVAKLKFSFDYSNNSDFFQPVTFHCQSAYFFIKILALLQKVMLALHLFLQQCPPDG